MEKPAFYCETCGSPVPRNASRCPSCGRIFDAVKCPVCGFEGSPGLFKNGCPSCGYGGTPASRGEDQPDRGKNSSRRSHPRRYGLVIAVLLAVLLVFLGLLVRRF
ncbi:MAG: hypothetical protein JW760_08635 [Spirochaetales bacterium]|nr:hypothetical protein [Spirochaetales bacterium]